MSCAEQESPGLGDRLTYFGEGGPIEVRHLPAAMLETSASTLLGVTWGLHEPSWYSCERLNHAGSDRKHAGDRPDPSQPLWVIAAEKNREPKEDERHSREREVEQPGKSEIDRLVGVHDAERGRLPGLRSRGPRVRQLLRRHPVENEEDQTNGAPDRGGIDAEPGDGRGPTTFYRVANGD